MRPKYAKTLTFIFGGTFIATSSKIVFFKYVRKIPSIIVSSAKASLSVALNFDDDAGVGLCLALRTSQGACIFAF